MPDAPSRTDEERITTSQSTNSSMTIQEYAGHPIRAAVLNRRGVVRPYSETEPLEIWNVRLGAPGPGEVLVQIKAAGLCHSDLSTINGDRPRPVPMVLGHEAAGIVAGVGEGVSDLEIGDHVIMVFVPSCGHCLPCMEGRPALCEPGAAANSAGTLLGGDRQLHGRGQVLNHHLGVSAFAEYAVVSRRSLVKIDRDLAFDEAAMFGCAVLTGVGAVINTARVPAGARIVILGLGGIGLSALIGAVAAGAADIIAVDLIPTKLSIAAQLGATSTINAGDGDAVDRVRDITGGGADFAFEMAGSVRAMEMAYRMTRRGGTTVTAGLPNPDDRWALQQAHMVAEERTVKGSYIGSAVPARDIPRYISLYRRGKLPIDKLMGERLTLDQINGGFDRLADGAAMRQIIVF
jgi:alcohol dehydrogenase